LSGVEGRGRICKDAFRTYFKVRFPVSLGDNEDNHEMSNEKSRNPAVICADREETNLYANYGSLLICTKFS
jgi:hypothetical protein